MPYKRSFLSRSPAFLGAKGGAFSSLGRAFGESLPLGEGLLPQRRPPPPGPLPRPAPPCGRGAAGGAGGRGAGAWAGATKKASPLKTRRTKAVPGTKVFSVVPPCFKGGKPPSLFLLFWLAGVFPPYLPKGARSAKGRPLSLPGLPGYSSRVVAVLYYTALPPVWQEGTCPRGGIFFPKASLTPSRCPASPGRPALSRG